MVVFEDGLARKSEYRRFSIPETTDDTDSIYRVLRRRLAYLEQGSEQAEGMRSRRSSPTRRSCSSSTAASRR
ncbi:hypothetical protein GCM10025874_08040 [Arenivirga flava]|uniref:UvrC family homology region profile domain-containing protein n=1 Tax=Arenivirga flava TaxID=1930060 RepID=A0AA37UGI0_9MICO|nr:hypothetical protein GCM10025874_08040 [Arenivirga flava]